MIKKLLVSPLWRLVIAAAIIAFCGFMFAGCTVVHHHHHNNVPQQPQVETQLQSWSFQQNDTHIRKFSVNCVLEVGSPNYVFFIKDGEPTQDTYNNVCDVGSGRNRTQTQPQPRINLWLSINQVRPAFNQVVCVCPPNVRPSFPVNGWGNMFWVPMNGACQQGFTPQRWSINGWMRW